MLIANPVVMIFLIWAEAVCPLLAKQGNELARGHGGINWKTTQGLDVSKKQLDDILIHTHVSCYLST